MIAPRVKVRLQRAQDTTQLVLLTVAALWVGMIGATIVVLIVGKLTSVVVVGVGCGVIFIMIYLYWLTVTVIGAAKALKR